MNHDDPHACVRMNYKGPVKLIKRVKIAHSFLVFVKSVPRYHFKLAYVILQMAVKELKPTSKNRETGRFYRFLLIESFLLTLKCH